MSFTITSFEYSQARWVCSQFVGPIHIETDGWDRRSDEGSSALTGINNMNTLPFDNVPYQNINAIGKQWIRNYALALSKEVLGQVRGKFGSIPIPGESVTLNASGPALSKQKTNKPHSRKSSRQF